MKAFWVKPLWLILVVGASAQATEPYQEYHERVKSAQNLTALTDALMGDSISLYNGATEFSVSDIDLQGNSTLPVRLTRRLAVELNPVGSGGGWDANVAGAGNWDVDVPYISMATLSQLGWESSRCSAPSIPTATGFSSAEFWRGNSVHVPEAGDRSMLWMDPQTPRPSGGVVSKWTTRERDMFTCIPMKSGLSGEGFMMRTSSGLLYYFDIAVSRYMGHMRRSPGGDMPVLSYPRTQYYLLASKVMDRFGNSVVYQYNANGNPVAITGNDGRKIALTYNGDLLTSATANARTWRYNYGTGSEAERLREVIQPDDSKWTYAYAGTLKPVVEVWDGGTNSTCSSGPPEMQAAFEVTATHPSGAKGTFTFSNLRHYRAGVHMSECQSRVSNGQIYWTLNTPNSFDVMSLRTKTLSGPEVGPMTWTYHYGRTVQSLWGGSGQAAPYPCTTCPKEKQVVVTQPDGSKEHFQYGFLYALNEGRQLARYVIDAAGQVVQAEITEYMDEEAVGAQPFRPTYGMIINGDEPSTARVRPVISRTIRQGRIILPPPPQPNYPQPPGGGGPAEPPPPIDPPPCNQYFCEEPRIVAPALPMLCEGEGCNQSLTPMADSFASGETISFTYRANTFDDLGRPLKIMKSSSLGFSRSEQHTYHDNRTNLWVLGQSAKLIVDGVAAKETGYDTLARPVWNKTFGKLQSSVGYNADGTVAWVKDGANRQTTLSSWYRGTPRNIEHADATSRSASVNLDGTISSVTDENGYKTNYGYDALGRLTRIVYPTGDDVGWKATQQTFTQVDGSEYGVPAGHWKQVVSTGNGRRVTYFDGFWRPLLVREFDTNNGYSNRFTRYAYDHEGRRTFASYPVASATSISDITKGIHTTYDALGRVRSVKEDSELGTLTTATSYLINSDGYYTKVTDPAGNVTRTWFQAFDEPSYERPVAISHPEGVFTDITRDIFGKPTALTRRDANGSTSVTRRYIYDAQQQLCKSIEPETGSMLVDYDAVGNVSWSASGLSLSSLACDRGSVPAGHKVARSYDSRNRLKTLAFPDGNGSQTWTYTADGLPATVITRNDGGNSWVTNNYEYNRRRLLVNEEQSMSDGTATWSIGYGYNANGHLSQLVYPAGLTVDYAPNALGQPTRAGDFATNVSYYPNGAIKRFTYGNGIVHAMTQNARQLPDRSRSVYGSAVVHDDSVDYDRNGNVAAISDALAGHRGDRTMSYDGLDRLTAVTSPMFPGGAIYNYDVLDNLLRVKAPGRDHTYHYDSHGRLHNVSNTSGGGAVIGLGYDPRGNLANKNGQTFSFDIGNRLRGVTNIEGYRYDALGRRIKQEGADNAPIYSVYSRDGQLLFHRDERSGHRIQYIRLGRSLIAQRKRPIGADTEQRLYYHTDALGTPVAITDAEGVVRQRSEYEAYGELVNRPGNNRPGYTGHMEDHETGLTYMQQRYYDPSIGRFLSVDPVSADSNSGTNFNRYWYANGNPYSLVDPDGRFGCAASKIAATCASYGMGPKDAIEAGWSVERRTDTADKIIENARHRLESRKGGNRFSNFDEAADHFRSTFAEVGSFLQLEFGAVSEPIVHNIDGITRSSFPEDFDGAIGVRISLGPTPARGADFHTHPDIYHSSPMFSGSDLQRAMRGSGRYSYVFYGYTTRAGKRLDVESAQQGGVAALSPAIYSHITDIP